MTTIFELLNKKFDSRKPKNPYDFIEYFNGQVKYTKSGTIGSRDNSVFIEISIKSDDGDFTRPGKDHKHGTRSIVAIVYKPASDEPDATPIVNYRTYVPKGDVQSWVRQVDADATRGLRMATFAYRLGEFIQSYQSISNITTTLTTHDNQLSQIEEILQTKPTTFAK